MLFTYILVNTWLVLYQNVKQKASKKCTYF